MLTFGSFERNDGIRNGAPNWAGPDVRTLTASCYDQKRLLCNSHRVFQNLRNNSFEDI